MMWQLAPGAGGGTPPGYDDLVAEIETARGDRSQLDLRLDTISNFASPNAGGVISGQYYDVSPHAGASTTLSGTAGRIDLVPFYSSQSLTIDQLGVAVSTGVAAALGRCCIYEADAAGWPDALLFEGASNLDLSTTGYKAHSSINIALDSGRQYWFGFLNSSTATIRAVALAGAFNIGLNGSNGNGTTTYLSCIGRVLTYANPLPSSWVFNPSERASRNIPSIRYRAA